MNIKKGILKFKNDFFWSIVALLTHREFYVMRLCNKQNSNKNSSHGPGVRPPEAWKGLTGGPRDPLSPQGCVVCQNYQNIKENLKCCYLIKSPILLTSGQYKFSVSKRILRTATLNPWAENKMNTTFQTFGLCVVLHRFMVCMNFNSACLDTDCSWFNPHKSVFDGVMEKVDVEKGLR